MAAADANEDRDPVLDFYAQAFDALDAVAARDSAKRAADARRRQIGRPPDPDAENGVVARSE